ncbi:MAG: ATP-binding cassette domain-containing protein [Deltaproteobacteria bacterium]|nr:ATP-binding cassette domain-containing protein [Deltaproteobacteria bacterium]
MKIDPGVRLGNYKITDYELEHLSFKYAAGGLVFDDVSMHLPIGRIMHVTGPSGHGQSTFLKILALLSTPIAGKIRVNSQPVSEMTFEEFLPWRIEIGYTFEGGGLLANRTLEENLILPHLYHNLSEPDDVKESIRKIAKRFKFEAFLDRRPAMVSGGLRKLITILRPVLLRPSFLLMDDPFSGLDPDTSRELEKLVLELRSNSEIETIYFTSRDETWPGRLSAQSLWVENGKLEIREFKKASGGL